MTELSIGALAAETGSSVQTIRYYEKIGLLPTAARTNGNQRRYGPAHSGRLAFIRHSRELGFSIETIRALLDLCDAPDSDCGAADNIARQQLRAVEARIKQLNALRAELKRMIGECSGGRIAACHVIEVLADKSHAHCRAHHHGMPEPTAAA
ncbi:MerR family transcriptional regulator [Dongia rigui]|uniref:Helix-turn-helix domain-containing protein n=1 Tax=Dongia rigui TaxID=940149 RepID=A0ABU5DXB1_9PROT|nr:helix-turn-helix domain-containing protein [Dongia rigui]MDY0871932.1 helix-turn-helix domain-containing protein [Dongia rigui]